MNVIKNKKAWIKIAEAGAAVMIILAIVLVIISRQRAVAGKSEEIATMQGNVLDYIKEDDDLRSQILSGDSSGVDKIVLKFIPGWINYSVNICGIEEICTNPAGYIPKEVYTNEILIAANLTYKPENPVKLKLFFWEK